MNPGELNRRIELQHLVKQDDGQGGYQPDYVPHAIIWAKIAPFIARNVDNYEQITPEITHKITIRYRTDVKVTDKLKCGDREFEQTAPPINVRERDAYLQLQCREVVADG